MLIEISDPYGGLSKLNRGVLIKVRVEPINTLLVDMIKTSATGALLLICGSGLSPLYSRYWRRGRTTSRVSVFARLSQRSLGFGSHTFRGIHVGADASW
jgi:hypothetical protein